MNKIFAFILFIIGIGLTLTSACANPVVGYITPDAPLLDAWGIIWRIGLGLLLIILAILLGNLDSFSGKDIDDF